MGLMSVKEKDRLILDRDVHGEIARLGIESNPVDVEEVMRFTLEGELERLSELLKEQAKNRPRTAQVVATNAQIKRRMKQAEEDRGKLSERGIIAFDYLQLTRGMWNK